MVNNVSLQSILKSIGQNSSTNAAKKVAPAEKTAETSDNLKLSLQGLNLQKLSESGVPEISQAKLETLKSAIADGSYKVDYDKLAQALIEQNIIKG